MARRREKAKSAGRKRAAPKAKRGRSRVSSERKRKNNAARRSLALSDRDKQIVRDHIDRGEPLPPKYKPVLFADAPEVELVWHGKTSEVTSVVLPFQSIEQIDEPRADTAEKYPLFALDAGGRQSGGWTNKLIWGDNKLVLSSLKNGPLRREIEAAGGLKLIYIDPPFDVGADFSVNIQVGDESLTKEPSVIEELAWRDTWGRRPDSYLSMMYERLKLMHDLLAGDGAIFAHCDWRVNSGLRLILDEVFGPLNLRNQIAWCYSGGGIPNGEMPKKHDTILWYSASSEHWTYHPQYRPYSEGTVQRGRTAVKGEHAKLRDEGTPINDWWPDVKKITSPTDPEKLYYDTQKSEELLGRIIRLASNEDDLVADFFCGSGTTLAVAEKLGRRWIGCDLSRFAIHTTRKRLIGVQREFKAEGQPYRSFEILNLGKYERQHFVGIDPTLPEEQRRAQTIRREEHYLTVILSAYKAERVFQMPPFHGKKGSTAVVVGPIDAPVTQGQVNEIVDECRRKKIGKVDVLGFEFEMSLKPMLQDEAKAKGVSLSLKYIPKDVFDRRAVERGQVVFYDVAYVEVLPKVKKLTATVTLRDFGVFYRQDDPDALGDKLKKGGSKVTVEGGQVVKVTKDKKGKVRREVLTKKWTDWIDYWAVDFDYASRREIIRIVEGAREREVWTGNYIFENEWQSYRTRRSRALELTSAEHKYEKKGRYKIAVKVIDIFGNDTTKAVEVKV